MAVTSKFRLRVPSSYSRNFRSGPSIDRSTGNTPSGLFRAHSWGSSFFDPLQLASAIRIFDVKASLLRTAMILTRMSATRWAMSCNIEGNPAEPGNCLDHCYGTGNALASDVEGAAVRD
jgi:hypothetical protein